MKRWRIHEFAWVEDGTDILVLSTAEPLRSPIRLSGPAVQCWEILRSAPEGVTTEEIVNSLFPHEEASPAALSSIHADVDALCATLLIERVLLLLDE